MKAIVVMFDSLNRRFLQPYGCDWVQTPNFQRLAARSAAFDNCYVGSMPCMPARREIHTGRYNFLHRSWGPLEPFDDSMPQILRDHNVHTHLVSDHMHYWEDGGGTYHTRYSSWEVSRGQEGDAWKTDLVCRDFPPRLHDYKYRGQWERQEVINRRHMVREEDTPQAKTFAAGMEFLHTNHAADNWMLQIETFDPHEPYFVPQRFRDLYPDTYTGPEFDWPLYEPVNETPEQVAHCRNLSAALHTMCDWYLGQVVDAMDQYGLWNDTMLIVCTDHGFLMGEHQWWAKCAQPYYNEIAQTPLFVWDPRTGRSGVRRQSLVQTIDLAPTLLEYFQLERPDDMLGRPLHRTIADDARIREAGLFGMHGGHVNVTDGQYIYMRGPADAANRPVYQYTMMPTHMRSFFALEQLRDATLHEGFSFTKGCPIMKIPAEQRVWGDRQVTVAPSLLFDLQADPGQERPMQDKAVERRMTELLVECMRNNDAPPEQYQRLGL